MNPRGRHVVRANSLSGLNAPFVCLSIAAFLAAAPAHADDRSAPQAKDELKAGFESPPAEARPRVWWHWMNGNVTRDGITKDLQWMKRVGIGGLQNFDASLLTPQIVADRLVYMTPPWKEAFRHAASTAESLGLELAIAASPGWSETGGPWVKPADGVKKLVWSEAEFSGNARGSIRLPAPPDTTGPFLDYPVDVSMLAALTGKPYLPPTHYQDILVLAYRAPEAQELPTPRVTSQGKALDAAALFDHALTTAVDVPRGTTEQPAIVDVDYATPQTVRSITLFVSKGAAGSLGGANLVMPRVEASVDGRAWKEVADFEVSAVPTTVSFAPVTARSFRFVFAPNPAAQVPSFTPAPGADAGILAKLAQPSPNLQIAQLRLSGEAKVNRFESKAGFSMAEDYYRLDANVGEDVAGVKPADVVDVTVHMKTDGTLDWTPTPGRWRVVRLGYSLTGKTNHPASAEATGLEVDKYDGRAVRAYMEHYLDMYESAAGKDLVGAHGVRAILTDSIEVGPSNWTPELLDRFRRLRGYDPKPYLPALTGTIVGSRRQSDAFLYDYRRTLADLVASEHYETVAKVAHEHGLKVYGEALEGGRPSLGDDIDMRKYADYPMAALWTYEQQRGPRSTARADMKGAASTAHVYGQNIVAAESLTSALSPWAHAPAHLRRIIDLEFAHGINRPVIHTSVHQPLDDKQPGLSLAIFGQYFTRHETWAEMAKPWIDYIARNSYLLQQGRDVADVAYFYGEESPLSALGVEPYFPDAPAQYAYDFVNADAVLNVLQVDGTDLVAPSGARYKVLYLGGTSKKMTLPVLRRLASLAEAGATIVGSAPEGSPSLDEAPGEYAALVQKLWSGKSKTEVGRGRVIASADVESVLASLGVPPDFSYAKPAPDSEVLFVHRKLGDGDLYFVNNRRNRDERIEARFRVTGRIPELWRADTGTVEPLSYRIENDATLVPLDMRAEDSYFVVFRKPATAASAVKPQATQTPVMSFDGDWDVAFQPARGAPSAVKLQTLASLSEHAESGVRYFSGVATYTKTFALPKGIKPGQALVLDLGNIADVAEVRINGQLTGTAWHAPYQLDIGKAVRAGSNQLEIRVANLWVNRLIGDAQPGAQKVSFTPLPSYKADAPLRPSGLLGPVRLLAVGRSN
jgi:hypothetical protein